MRRTMRGMRGALFGVAVAGALGFGAREALAVPQQQATPLRCDSATCNQLCTTIGFGNGFCSRGSCFCYG